MNKSLFARYFAVLLFLLILSTIGVVAVSSQGSQSIVQDVTAYGLDSSYRNPDRVEGWQSLFIDVTVWGLNNGS